MRGKREMPRQHHPLRAMLCAVLVCGALTAGFLLLRGGGEPQEPLAHKAAEEGPAAQPQLSAEPLREETPQEAPQEPPQETPAEPQNRFVLSFLGDCTLASSHYTGHFESVVGDDLAYPFSNVAQILLEDDLTLANLECSFSRQRLESESEYAFCGQPRYARSLVLGGVECVSMGNNHTNDFGRAGVEDTLAALEQEGVCGIGEGESACFELRHEDGTSVRVGIYVRAMTGWTEQIEKGVTALRADGADIVIVCMHAGAERIYVPTTTQTALARAAVRAGADLVVGTHPHILQPTETYEDGLILYSLGNFCFGGNRGPKDMDTVIAQMVLQVDGDGVSWEMEYIPCSISSVPGVNDYRPTPYEAGTAGYERCLQKLKTPWDPTTAEEAAAAKAAEEAQRAEEQAAQQTPAPQLPAEEADGSAQEQDWPVFAPVTEQEPL